MIGKRWGFLLTALFAATGGYGQFHSEGQDPFSTRWRQIDRPGYRLIFPENYARDARRVATVIDTAGRALQFGFALPPQKLPFVLHTQNLRSNGLVVWAPKRAELVATPPTATYAVPWLKQLTLHEYRHVVQMSNLDRGFVKFVGYLAGQQAVGAAAVLLPVWFLEGDAVMAETELSAYGRGLQPEFTLEYRAYLADGEPGQFPVDKWFCGSFRDYIPDRYQLGYQLTAMSYTLYGPRFWDTVTDYAARHPYFILPTPIAFRRFYKTSSARLFWKTFDNLKSYWDALPQPDNSARFVPTPPPSSYTLYSYPVPVNDTLTVALKYDFDRPHRLVRIDPRTGAETLLAYTGEVSSRPAYRNGELFWTEYAPSTFWEQKDASVVCRMPLAVAPGEKQAGRSAIRRYRRPGNLFYVTPAAGGCWAVRYDDSGKYAVCRFDDGFRETKRHPLPDSLTVHGLAWDGTTGTLALIALSEDGMALTGVDTATGKTYAITRPSFVTINHLSAGDGKLFFNSIGSGRDETHLYDLRERKEYRATVSRFGSVMPAPAPDGNEVVQATYRKEGYFVSRQRIDPNSLVPVSYSRLPVNLLNPPRMKWNVLNADTLRLYGTGDDTTKYRVKRYRRGTHLFDFHSWAPLGYDPFDVADERNLRVNAGATLITQNALSTLFGYFGYDYADGESRLRGALLYDGFALKLEVKAEYGGGKRLIYVPAGTDTRGLALPSGAGKEYFALTGSAYLPFDFSSGYMLRSLTPSVSVTRYNSLLYRPADGAFDKGYEKTEATLSYTQYVRRAYRDLAPRWGFGARVSWAGAPFDGKFGNVYSLSGNVYAPGILPHHSLLLRGAVQYQDRSVYNFRSNVLFPIGCRYDFAPERLWAVTGSYRFPLVCPDGGISGLIYFRRISLGLLGGYSRYRPIAMGKAPWRRAYSYGGEITVDANPLRMDNANMVVNLSVYKPSDSRRPGVSFGITVFQ